MFLIKFIFLLFIAFFIFILLTAFRFISTFRSNMNKFNRRSQGFGQQQQGNQQRRTYGQDGQEQVFDTREPEEANKKIFKEDEGEYVDYVEE